MHTPERGETPAEPSLTIPPIDREADLLRDLTIARQQNVRLASALRWVTDLVRRQNTRGPDSVGTHEWRDALALSDMALEEDAPDSIIHVKG